MLGTTSIPINDNWIAASGHKAEIISANRAHVYAQIARAVIVHAKTAEVFRICFVPAKIEDLVLDIPYDNPLTCHKLLGYFSERKPSALPESLGINPLLVDNSFNTEPSAF